MSASTTGPGRVTVRPRRVFVSASLIRELAADHHLEVEERQRAYLFRALAWQGQVLRMSYVVVSLPRPEVLRGFARAVGMMPLPSKYAGLFLKKLRGTELDAYLFRAEHRAQLEA